MSILVIALLVMAALAFIVFLWGVGIYNGLVALRLAVKNAFAQIDVQLKRRHDLIPNLVSTVKGYASHETETFERVISARARATGASAPAERLEAEGELTQAVSRLLAVAEAYPELKANQNFMALQGELTSTEDKISHSRNGYNDVVTRYNTGIQVFPAVILAGILNFKAEPFFEVPSEQRETPKVQF